MKLTPSQKSLVFELIATGVRPCEIVRKINEELKSSDDTKDHPKETDLVPFVKEQVSYYLKVFRSLTPQEQIKHLPYTKQPSFALQETRINDDIQDLIMINEIIDERKTVPQLTEKEEKEKADKGKKKTVIVKSSSNGVIDLVRAKISIKNRIAQELGQALAYSKAGVGNLTIMQNIFNQYRGFIKGAEGLPQEDVVDLLGRLDEVKEEKADDSKASTGSS